MVRSAEFSLDIHAVISYYLPEKFISSTPDHDEFTEFQDSTAIIHDHYFSGESRIVPVSSREIPALSRLFCGKAIINKQIGIGNVRKTFSGTETSRGNLSDSVP
jgi:hypothetical protein